MQAKGNRPSLSGHSLGEVVLKHLELAPDVMDARTKGTARRADGSSSLFNEAEHTEGDVEEG